MSESKKVKFKVGDKVVSRGDMGYFKMTVERVPNNHYVQCRYGRSVRHWNAEYLTKLPEPKQ